MQSGFENDPQEERGLIYENVELRLTNYPCEVFDKTAHPYWMTQMEIDFLIDGVRFVWVVFDKMLDPYGVTQIAILIVGSESVGIACACSCSNYNDASLGGFSSNWLLGPILLSGYQFLNLHNHSLTAPIFVQLGSHFFVSYFWRTSVSGYLAKWFVSGSHSGAVSSFKLDFFFISQKGVFFLNALSYAELASRFPAVVMEHTYTNTPLSMRLRLSPYLRN